MAAVAVSLRVSISEVNGSACRGMPLRGDGVSLSLPRLIPEVYKTANAH